MIKHKLTEMIGQSHITKLKVTTS